MGMIKKDLLMIKNNRKSIIIAFVLYIMYSIMFEIDMSFFLTIMGLMMCVSTLNYDDFNNWHIYAGSLPQGRINVVKSKYITSIIVTSIFTILGEMMGLLISFTKGNYNLENMISSGIGGLIASIFIMSILYPIVFKYGAEKGRIAITILGVGIVGVCMLFTSFINIDASTKLIDSLDIYFPVICIIGSILMISISYIISKKVYLKREF